MIDMNSPRRVYSLVLRNIGKLEGDTRLVFGTAPVKLLGANGTGKSTIASCLLPAAQKVAGPGAVTRGQREGEVKIDLGDLIVEQRYYKSKTGAEKMVLTLSEVRVDEATGEKTLVPIAEPATTLKKLWGKVAANPVALVENLKTVPGCRAIGELLSTLLKYPDVDLKAHGMVANPDEKLPATVARYRQLAYDARTVVNRDVDRLTQQLKGLAVPPEHQGAVPVVVSTLSAELETVNTRIAAYEKLEYSVEEAENAVNVRDQTISDLELQITNLKDQLARAKDALAVDKDALIDVSMRFNDGRTRNQADRARLTAIRTELAAADETNKWANTLTRRNEVQAELSTAEGKAAVQTGKIEDADALLADIQARSTTPIPEMTFDPEIGLLWDGKPWTEWSFGETLTRCTLLAIAEKPSVGMLVLDPASEIDDGNLATIYNTANPDPKHPRYSVLETFMVRGQKVLRIEDASAEGGE